MKVCVFGADGRTGVEVIKYAREVGMEAVAFVYDPGAKEYLPSGINIVQGDILKKEDVSLALKGCDGVISVVGHIKNSDPFMQTKGIENIVSAMNEVGLRRIVSLTGTGARMVGDKPSLIDKILNFMVGLVDPDRIKDGTEHLKVLQGSDLDWTVVRVLKLSKSEKSFGEYKITDTGPAELLTSRKKVAKVLVDVFKNHSFVKKAPVISG